MSCAHVVIFMHIPLFLSSGDEEDSYFAIPQRERMSMLERFADAGVSKVFSGHYHRNGGGVWTRTNSDGSTSQVRNFCHLRHIILRLISKYVQDQFYRLCLESLQIFPRPFIRASHKTARLQNS